jgi:hypothetical protein
MPPPAFYRFFTKKNHMDTRQLIKGIHHVTATVNDAIEDDVSIGEMVYILQPKLDDDLGYGLGAPNSTLRAVAWDVLERGNGPHGTYDSFTAFWKTYERAIRHYRSGQ